MLVLVRHGQSEANAAQLLSGRAESALTDKGLSDVASLAPLVKGASALVSSPLARARRSAAALGLDLEVEVDERWVEIDYGEFEGVALRDVPAPTWRSWRSDPTFRPPGGESLADVGERVRAVCRQYFVEAGAPARRPDGDIVVVSHVSPIKAAVTWALGVDDAAVWRLHLDTASMTVIGWGTDAPVLHRYNVTGAK